VIRALSVHAAVEEQVLYPAVRKQLPDGEQQADHAIEEHQEVKETLAELEKVGASAPEATQLLHNLMSSVRNHVREEENDMFPRLRASLSANELEEMRDAVVKAKESAPTHPHPKAPSTPPGNIVAGAVARVVDKIRDTAGGSSEK
jgi:hemerythrin-like domain-containing protein